MPNETNELDGLEFLFEPDMSVDILGPEEDEIKAPAQTPTNVTKPEDLDIFRTNPNDDIIDDEEEETVNVTSEDDDEEEEEDSSPEAQLAGLANYFSKVGIFKVKEGEDFSKITWTEDSFIEKFQETKKAEAIEELERIVTERMGEAGPDFVQKVFVEGMPYQAYLNSFAQERSYERLDPADDKQAAQIVTAYLESRGLDEEEIETQVSFLKENSLLSKKAEKFKGLLVEDEKGARENYAKEVQERQRLINEREQKRYDSYSETIKESLKVGNILGVPVTTADSKALYQFVTDKPHVLQNGQKLTDFEYKIAKIRHEEPQKFLAIAKLLMDEVDLSKVVREKKSQETNSLYNELKLTKKKTTKKSEPNLDFLFK